MFNKYYLTVLYIALQATGAYPTQAGGVPPGYHTQSMVHGTYDTGARFDGIAKHNIPVSIKHIKFVDPCSVLLNQVKT